MFGKRKSRVMPTQDNLFDNQWRKMKWDEKQALERKLRNFNIRYPAVGQLRILVIGPVGTGKSSFIKSVNNVFQGRITSKALADALAGGNFTKEYTSHYIEGNDGYPLPFVFNDVMGLEPEQGGGVHQEDIVKALQGHVMEGYRFNPVSSISESDQHYRSNPDPKDQVSCLVYVLSADNVIVMDRKVFDKMRYIREKASGLHIPQVILMTKPEKACPLVKKDLRKIYDSKKIKDNMKQCSDLVGVTMDHVFPVKNYHEEIYTEDDMDVLILKALEHIVNIGNDSLKKPCSDNSNQWNQKKLTVATNHLREPHKGEPSYLEPDRSTVEAKKIPPPVPSKPPFLAMKTRYMQTPGPSTIPKSS